LDLLPFEMGPLRWPETSGTDYPVTQHNISDEQKIQWHRRESLKTCMVFEVCKSVHYHTIQINQPTRGNNLSSLLLDVYLQLNMFRASSRP